MATSSSTVSKREGRRTLSVSTRTRSGGRGSSAKRRARSRIVSRPSGESTSALSEKATAVSRVRVPPRLAGPPALAAGGGGEPQAAARDVHPVDGRALVVPQARAVGGERGREAP